MDALYNRLERMPDSDLIEFDYEFNEALEMSLLMFSPDHEKYMPWGSEDTDWEFAYWLVSLGRKVWETVQNDPPSVKYYADLFLEGKEETLPQWTWKGEPRYDAGLPSMGEGILLERGMNEHQVFELMQQRGARPL